ncbi:hypothetical protein PPROV_000634000 [Pycnococcus provasolii]|uniref:Uncharacterized protein n=1 Tax=Pycnococcus provasolii TaxID=41880 RepID=A0A830HL50_9CHLO|nr:hypothetical protein PPROV_000634000 [Pycnococcus provasolii]
MSSTHSAPRAMLALAVQLGTEASAELDDDNHDDESLTEKSQDLQTEKENDDTVARKTSPWQKLLRLGGGKQSDGLQARALGDTTNAQRNKQQEEKKLTQQQQQQQQKQKRIKKESESSRARRIVGAAQAAIAAAACHASDAAADAERRIRDAERRAESADQLLAQTAERASMDRLAWAAERDLLKKQLKERDAQVQFLQRAHATASDRCGTLSEALTKRTLESRAERDGLRYLVKHYSDSSETAAISDPPYGDDYNARHGGDDLI